MGTAKWIGGIVGFMAGGPLGALAGYALGSLFEQSSNSDAYNDSDYQRSYRESQQTTYDTGQQNSFRFALLVMASYIIKADGKVMHSEMEYVRRFLRTNFGESAMREGEQILLNLFEQRKQMDQQNPLAFKTLSGNAVLKSPLT